ncbi:MAG: SDR family NAD(P)-dependent oxidoreductase [Chlorobi bacterium]|nr:SDR family NAD(P)-dependent oxidoreductase [Chlorobiota bacterium]
MKKLTILITGSTDGIGKQTALDMAVLNWNVIVHGRSEQKVTRVVNDMRKQTGQQNISGVWGDMHSLHKVKKMAAQVREQTGKLDVLLNNAGVIMPVYRQSADGYEMTFAVNYLAHFYLTYLLFPIIYEKGRIINVTSQVHSQTINLKNLNDPSLFSSIDAYSDSKMCNVLFTYALDRRINGNRDITVNCLHPGVVNTKMLIQTWGRIGIPVEEGARNSVYVATSPVAGKISAAYFRNMKTERSAPATYDTALQDELWKMSMEIVHKAGLEFDEAVFTS